ncbi:MAG: acyl-CoA dehydrogenase family protein [Myxococcota bacterium]
MGNFFKDNDDLKFYVDEWIDWEPLVRLTENDYNYEYGFQDADEAVGFYRDVLEMIGKFVAEEIDPLVAEMEREHPKLVDGEVVFPDAFDEIFEKISQLDLHGMCVPRELGGMNAPLLVYMIQTEIMGRADVSISAHHSFHGGLAMALLAYSIDEETTEIDPETGEITSTRFQGAIEEIMSGDAWGSMDITEPGAGSDMAAMRTKAEQDEDGNWYVTGEKIFITSGHGKYHVVIARTEEDDDEGAFSGLDKLSTFLVPAYVENEDGERERVADVVRLEEKMGHHLSATCAMSFDKTPAYLIGDRGEGFKQMLLLMNNARVGVAFECVGLCEAAYRMARDYAEERESMGKTIDRHEMIADYLEDMKTWIYGIRAITVKAGWYEEMAQKLRMHALRLEKMEGDNSAEMERLEKKAEKYQWKARELTPLCKYIGAEKAVEMARMNIQIHGGSGYTQEYGAEKLLRDAVVMPIYEGTSQIQALMAMKDAMSTVMRNPQKFIKKLAQTRWRSLSSRDPQDKKLATIEHLLLRAKQYLVTRTAVDKFKSVSDLPMTEWLDALKEDWDPKRDFAHAMLHAERLIKMKTDLAVAQALYEQQKEYPERTAIFESFVERAEPRCRYLFDEITTTGDRLINRLHPEQLEEAAE